jgi:intein/homing endonuclease
MKVLKVKSVKKLNQKHDVYDLTTEMNHNFVANNMVIHNCGK